MQLSRGRVLLRAALLLGGGAWMLWRAWGAHAASERLPAADALLTGRIALVEALVGALAVLTGVVALSSLRPRARRRTLRLRDP